MQLSQFFPGGKDKFSEDAAMPFACLCGNRECPRGAMCAYAPKAPTSRDKSISSEGPSSRRYTTSPHTIGAALAGITRQTSVSTERNVSLSSRRSSQSSLAGHSNKADDGSVAGSSQTASLTPKPGAYYSGANADTSFRGLPPRYNNVDTSESDASMWDAPSGIRAFPAIFSFPSRDAPMRHWPNIVSLIMEMKSRRRGASTYFAASKPIVHAEPRLGAVYYLAPVERNLTLLVTFEDPKPAVPTTPVVPNSSAAEASSIAALSDRSAVVDFTEKMVTALRHDDLFDRLSKPQTI